MEQYIKNKIHKFILKLKSQNRLFNTIQVQNTVIQILV